MRSQLIESAPLESQVSVWPWKREDADARTQEAVYQICLKHKTYSHPDTIAVGDIVRVRLDGPAPRFSRTVWITVGGGMFDRELEGLMIGLTRGSEGTLLHSAGAIRYQIIDIQRLIVPGLNDSIAQAEQVDGVDSADQLYRHIKTEMLKEVLYDQVFGFLTEYQQRCSFDLDPSEIEEMVQAELTRCRGISQEMGMVFDDMSREELLGAVGQPDIPSFCAMVRDFSADILRRALLGCEQESVPSADVSLQQVPSCSYHYLLSVRDMAINYV